MAAKEEIKYWGTLALLVAAFAATSYFSQRYSEPIQHFVQGGPGIIAAIAFIVICALSVIVPPIASIPFLPAATQVWGGLLAGAFTASGWIIGSLTAFYLARRYGQRWVAKITSERELEHAQRYIPENTKGVVWFLIILQIVLPVDLLSYTIGLFTRIPFGTFAIATSVGNIPSGLIFAYLGDLSLKWQVLGFLFGGLIATVGLVIIRKQHKQIDHRRT